MWQCICFSSFAAYSCRVNSIINSAMCSYFIANNIFLCIICIYSIINCTFEKISFDDTHCIPVEPVTSMFVAVGVGRGFGA